MSNPSFLHSFVHSLTHSLTHSLPVLFDLSVVIRRFSLGWCSCWWWFCGWPEIQVSFPAGLLSSLSEFHCNLFWPCSLLALSSILRDPITSGQPWVLTVTQSHTHTHTHTVLLPTILTGAPNVYWSAAGKVPDKSTISPYFPLWVTFDKHYIDQLFWEYTALINYIFSGSKWAWSQEQSKLREVRQHINK